MDAVTFYVVSLEIKTNFTLVLSKQLKSFYPFLVVYTSTQVKKIANGVNNDIYTQLSQIKKENKLRQRKFRCGCVARKSCTKFDKFIFVHRIDMVYESLLLMFNSNSPINKVPIKSK